VEIKANRRSNPVWQDDLNPSDGASDIVTILLDRKPVRSLEVFHSIKDQRFRDYPATTPLASRAIPTVAVHEVVDLDNDSFPEVVLELTNQVYALHSDRLVSVLVIDPRGRIAKTPYPDRVAGLAVGVLSPYSAFQTTGVMLEAISSQTASITYANGFEVSERGGRKILLFSWVIDSAPYADAHLHQVQEMGFQDGELVRVSEPKFYVSNSWDEPWSKGVVVDSAGANAFLAQHNLPSVSDMLKAAKASFEAENAAR
jgi:hypothetical protein